MMSRFSIPPLFLILCSTFVYGINSEPVITLNGPNPQYVDSGGVYEELGAVAYDNEDGSLTDQIVISGSVNTNYSGNYTIQYVVTDSDGNSIVMNRTVIVENISSILISKTSTITQNDSNSTVDIGDVITYTIKVKNTGNSELNGVVIDDELSDLNGDLISLTTGPTFTSSSLGGSTTFTSDPNTSVATLQVGEEVTFTATFTVTQPVIDTGGVSNIASVTATADDADNTAVSDEIDDAVVTLINAEPSIEVTKTAIVIHNGDGFNGSGDTIIYTITIENTGNVTLTGIAITDTMTDGAGQSLTLTSPGTFSTYTLAPGETVDIQATYTIEQSAADTGSISNTVSVVGTAPDGTDVLDHIDAPVVILTYLNPSISISKTSSEDDGGDGKMDIGDTIDYTIEITNTGNVTLDDIILSDILTDGDGNTTDLTSLLTLSSVNGIPQSILTSLSVGDVATYTLRYTVNEIAMNSGMVSNMATVTASSPTGTNDTTDSTDSAVENELDQSPLMSLTKTATLNDGGDGKLDIGDTIEYTITVENSSNVTLSNLSLTDTLTDLNGNSLALTSGPTFISNSSSSSEGTLQSGETATYIATYVITQSAIDAGGVSNTATAESFAPDGTSISDVSDDGHTGDSDTGGDPTITILTSQPIDNEKILLNGNVYITKSNGLIIKSGDECYRIKVNNGNVVAEPVNCE